MPLSNLQKIRLQQMVIPRWELRQHSQALKTPPLETDVAHQIAAPVCKPLQLISESGSNPKIVFWSESSTQIPPQAFLEDLNVAMNHRDDCWQMYTGDESSFRQHIANNTDILVILLFSQQYPCVELIREKNQAGKPLIEIHLPAIIHNQTRLKKELWGAIYQSCYH